MVAINVGRVPQDRRLVEALTHTMGQIFPTIHTVDVPGTLNTVLFASVQETDFAVLEAYLTTLPTTADPLLRGVLQTAVNGRVPTTPSDLLFTDERAPVETLIDSLVIRFVLSEGVRSLPRTSIE